MMLDQLDLLSVSKRNRSNLLMCCGDVVGKPFLIAKDSLIQPKMVEKNIMA